MCCSSFLKIMMFIFNGAIFLAGAAILGVGVWVRVDSSSLLDLLNYEEDEGSSGLEHLYTISYVAIAIGAVLVIIGFLGCCGAVRESKCMLLTFFSIVLIIFLIEVAGAVVLIVFKDTAGDLLQDVRHKISNNINTKYGDDEELTSRWKSTMEQFRCCGINNYTDFIDSPFNNEQGAFPTQCCNGTISEDSCSQALAEMADVDGCFDKLLQLIKDNAVIIAGVALGIAALEIAAMVVSMVLYCRIGNKA
ncbi:tetraspanin-1-like [Chaetodon trifascialis]|uniref:tetraspanin-1-like n=1 Tax=Chaetodon trifascialis TaxID=109706 RepID=UPI0039930581